MDALLVDKRTVGALEINQIPECAVELYLCVVTADLHVASDQIVIRVAAHTHRSPPQTKSLPCAIYQIQFLIRHGASECRRKFACAPEALRRDFGQCLSDDAIN